MSLPGDEPAGFNKELAETLFVSRIGLVPPYAAASLESFVVAVHRHCDAWLRANAANADTAHALAFVLTERPEIDPTLAGTDFKQVGRLDVEGAAEDVTGKIILTTRNLRLAFTFEPPLASVAAIVSELKSRSLSNRPTAIFVPAERMLTVYRRGVDDEPTAISDMEALAKLDPTDISAILAYFHENWTRFPDGRGTCWDNASNRVVEKNAERNVRNALFNLLELGLHRAGYVIRELQLPNGRADICILGYATAADDQPRVIELKVLRSRPSGWSPGDLNRPYSRANNERYVKLGLLQASRYKQSSTAVEAHLACFDAQLENEELDVLTRASELGVSYHRFFMESSVKGS